MVALPWPKPMTIERIFLEARLNSWTYLVIALSVCWISVGVGAFFIWNSLYGSQPWQPTRGILVGMLLVIVFSVIGLFVIAVMIAKVVFLPYRVFRQTTKKSIGCFQFIRKRMTDSRGRT